MTDGTIQLHPKHGVNPRLCFCPRCGGESNMLMLIGTRNYVTTCPHCGVKNYGSKRSELCGKCGSHMHNGEKRELDDHEKLPGDFCEECKKEAKEHAAIVARGGVYFRCKACNACGVIKEDVPFAAEVRKAHGLLNGEPCGVEFDKTDCPRCRKEPDGE